MREAVSSPGARASAGLASILSAALLISGCVLTGAGPGGAGEESGAGPQPTVAKVTNESLYQVAVFAITETERNNLGSVNSQQSQFFELPDRMVRAGGSLRLVADPVGESQNYVSDPLALEPGQFVDWQLKNVPGQSFLVVR